MSVLTVKGLNQSYGGSRTLWDVDLRGAGRIAHVPDGPQRYGAKTTLPKCTRGPAAVNGRGTDVRRNGFARAARGEPRAPGHRLRPPGARDFFASHCRGESADRPGDSEERPAHHSAADFRSLSGAWRHAATAWRGSFRRDRQQQLAIGRAPRPRARNSLVLDEPTEQEFSQTSSTRSAMSSSASNRDAGVTMLLVEQKSAVSHGVWPATSHSRERASCRRQGRRKTSQTRLSMHTSACKGAFYLSTIRMVLRSIRSFGVSPVRGAASIASMAAMPSNTTLANAVY